MVAKFDDDGSYSSSAEGLGAVEAQERTLALLIKSRTQIKLGIYILSAFFIVTASVLIVFAPPGRETATWIIAGTLAIIAAGAAGFSSFRIRVPKLSAEFGKGEPSSGSST